MKLLKISKVNSLVVNLLHSASYAMVCGYIIMVAAWLIKDMGISLVECFNIWVIAIVVIFCLLGTVSALIDIKKHIELDELAQHRLTKGYDDEYFRKLAEFSKVSNYGSGKLFMASMYLEGGRFADSRSLLKEVDFSKFRAECENISKEIAKYKSIEELLKFFLFLYFLCLEM